MFFCELALNIARELLAQWSVFILVHIGIHLAQLGTNSLAAYLSVVQPA